MSEDDYGQQGGMPPPDWGRFGAHSRAQDTSGKSHVRLGDPTRWGGQVVQSILQGAGVGVFASPQFIRAQVVDVYSRPWIFTGVVHVPQLVWTEVIAVGAGGWQCLLELQQGAGQQVITQNFDLRRLTSTQLSTSFGVGPGVGLGDTYAPTFTNGIVNSLGASGAFEGRSFTIGLGRTLGQQWGARIVQQVGGVHDFISRVEMIATPFDAGAGV